MSDEPPVPDPGVRAEGEPAPHSTTFVLGVLTFQQILGGLTFPIAKYGLEQIEPFTFAFYRFVFSSIVLLAIARFRHGRRAPVAREDYWKIAGLGFLIIPFNQVAYLFGQSLTGAGHGALLFATTPIWIFILALIHLHEKFVPRRAVGVAVGIIGVAVIMFSGTIHIGTEYLIGDLIIVGAVIAWAYYTIFGKPLVRKYGAIRVTAYALASGTALYVPFGLWRAIVFDYSSTTIGAWLSVLYIAFFVSGVVYILWYWVLKYLEVSRVAVFQNIQPVIASGVAYFFLAEPLGWSFVVGALVVLTGVIITEV